MDQMVIVEADSRCEICGASRNLEVHHIEPRGMGGSRRPEIEEASNKAVLCRSCHIEITEQRWRLERSERDLVVTAVATGEVVLRRLSDPDFDPSQYFQELNLVESQMNAIVRGVPYLTDDQLVDLFGYLRSLDQRTWKTQAAILWEAKQRSVYGDRAWEAMGRSFGIGWRQAYNLARVEALGRRGGKIEASRVLNEGPIVMDLERHRVTRSGERIDLSPREFEVLQIFMTEPSRTFTRDEICERIWEREHEYDTRTVEIFVMRLRRKLDQKGDPSLITTVRGIGYSLRQPET